MKDAGKPEKPPEKRTIPVKPEDGKVSCPVRVEDILKGLAAGGG